MNILITGGSKGIGKSLVENLALDGHHVLLNYNNSETDAKKIQLELQNKNVQIEIYKADVTKREEVNKMVEFCLKKFGNIDVLINNAGISQEKPFADLTENDWNNMINVNLNSMFNTTQEVLHDMLKYKNGCIINISSVWGIIGGSCEVHYSAAKAGVIGFTKALAKELAPSNIRVNCIAPGCILTDMLRYWEDQFEEVKKEIPLGKIGRPEDIYKCAKWLIEDEFTTGQVISPNGGQVI